MTKIEKLYTLWHKESVIFTEFDGYILASLPFVDLHNDCFEFMVKPIGDDEYIITDNGDTILGLIDFGIELSHVGYKEHISFIVKAFGLELNKTIFSIRCCVEDIPFRLTELTEAMLMLCSFVLNIINKKQEKAVIAINEEDGVYLIQGEYTDGGCTIWECGDCGVITEMRTFPWVGGGWNFCPKCGKKIIAIRCKNCSRKIGVQEYLKNSGSCKVCADKFEKGI